MKRTEATHDSAYAWWRLTMSLVLSSVGGIGLWSVVVTLPAIEAEFAIDRGDASLPYLATMAGFAVGGLFMGRIADRYGITASLVLGGIMLGIGYVTAAQAANLWQFIAVQALLIGMLGSSVSFGPLVADVSLWFIKRRGIAVGIVASGNYLSGTIWPPILQHLIDTVGWRQAHVTVGLVCVAIIVPLAFALRRRAPREDTGARVTAAGTPQESGLSPRMLMVLLSLAGFACCVAMSMPQVHIVAYCVDLGYGSALGAEMLSVMLGMGIISRLASGAIADKIGGLGTLILGSSLQGLALAFFLPFDGLTSLFVVSALFGLAQGGLVPSYALIVREYFPAREAGTRVSAVLMMTIVGMAAGGWISGEIQAFTGSYDAAFLNGIAFNLMNLSIALWLLTRRWRAARATAG